jgi:hypothetical protein
VPQGCLYFRCADIALAVAELEKRGPAFTGKPHLIARMDDHDLWMAFLKDPDDHTLALMQEAPKGYEPAVWTTALTAPTAGPAAHHDGSGKCLRIKLIVPHNSAVRTGVSAVR